MAGYTRQDTGNNIANGNIIDADYLDEEFNAVEGAFSVTTGHRHDGTAGEGPAIVVVGPAQEYLAGASEFAPKADSTYALGTTANRWSNIFTDQITLGAGVITWNPDDTTLNVALNATGVTLQVGQEVLVRVQNDTGLTLSNGTLVQYAGAIGASGYFRVEPFNADSTGNSRLLVGMLTEDIANGDVGFATAFGFVRGLDTSAVLAGTTLWANPAVDGGLVNAEPQAPNLKLPVAIVINSHATQGTLFVRTVGLGTSLADDSLVQLSSLANNDILVYNSTTGRFENSSDPVFTSLTVNGNIGVTGTVDGRNLSNDGNKLDGIEAGANVTDTANVTAAGALMDSELTNIAAVKALNQGVSTTNSPSFSGLTSNGNILVSNSGGVNIGITSTDSVTSQLRFGDGADPDVGYILYVHSNDNMAFVNGASETMRLNGNALCIGRFSPIGTSLLSVDGAMQNGTLDGLNLGTGTQAGSFFTTTAGAAISADGTSVLGLRRRVDDGALVTFFQGTTQEGSISVSGTTVSYNGGHLSRWSQFPDKSTPELLKGTVMTNLDQMADWGKEDNEQLNCVEVSSVEGDKNVAGVFVSWDTTDGGSDLYLAMTGDMVIRVGKDTKVERGDLLMSAGDGTAMPQADDLIRSCTIAKVTSTVRTIEYPDGSYCVPCVLMAC